MRRTLLAVLVTLAGVLPALADPPKIEGVTKWDANKLVRVSAKGLTPDDAAMWKVRPLDDANEGKVDVSAAGLSGGGIEWTAPPGRYRVEVTVGRVKDGKLSLTGDEMVITIGQPPDVPPTPPVVVDKLVDDLRAALKADPDAALGPKFVAVYRTTATAAGSATTWGGLFEGFVAETKRTDVFGKMIKVQTVAQVFLKSQLPSTQASDTAVSAADRTKAATAYNTLAAALEKAAK